MSVKPLEMPPTLNTKPDFSVKLFLGSLENGQMYLDSARRPWSTPAAPLLMTKAMACAEGTPVIEVPENAMDVELVIENELEDLQVAHLHGTRFQVMTVAEQGALHDSPAPLLRDTVVVPARGIVVLRMLATNPGFWVLHTLSANARQRGAATVLSVLPSKLTPVPDYVPRTICPSELTV
jgi:iron transport multicopper oxidase